MRPGGRNSNYHVVHLISDVDSSFHRLVGRCPLPHPGTLMIFRFLQGPWSFFPFWLCSLEDWPFMCDLSFSWFVCFLKVIYGLHMVIFFFYVYYLNIIKKFFINQFLSEFFVFALCSKVSVFFKFITFYYLGV